MKKGQPGKCAVCLHPDRRQIEIALVYQTPLSVLATRFGVSKHGIYRHGKNHLTPVMRAAILASAKPAGVDLEELQRNTSEGLLSQLLGQQARLQEFSNAAFEAGQVATAISAERAITDVHGLTSKLLGMLVQRHEVTHTSILVSPGYLDLRDALLRALRPHPAAARDVAGVLHELEAKAATDIRERAAAGKPVRPPLVIEHQANGGAAQ